MARHSGTRRRGTGAWLGSVIGLSITAWACGDDGQPTGSGESGNDDGATSTGGADSGSETSTPMLPEGCDMFVAPSADDQTAVQEAFIDVTMGQTLCLGTGTFTFTRQLSLDADGVTVRGEGGEATILDFSGQISGANGISITGNGVTIADLQVLDPPGDGIRGDKIDDITFDGVHVIWPDAESTENGAYGLYPVQCNGVTIRNSVIQGSRDAGVYVGQSTNILVENNEARGNVAGIEIENSTDAIVRGNYAHDNTAGILVFNLPGLDVGDGQRTNIYENIIENNNTPNFGEAGTVVSMVPPGIGVLVLAADRNEVADNEIRGNDSVGVVVLVYSDMLFPPPDDPDFDIYAEGNFIHDNLLEDNGANPADLILLVTEAAMPGPAIMFDGCWDEAKDNADGSLDNCVMNNGDGPFMAVNLCGQGMLETDATNYTCEHELLPREL
jgi:parallel beta-helix repeat protein